MLKRSDDMQSNLYVGLAGETESYPGYPRRGGFYRSRGGTGPWERCTAGLPEHVEIRAMAVHPRRLGCLYLATQHGIYRTEDEGDHFERLRAPEPGMAVWSLCFHPQNPSILVAGYEPFAIWYTEDGGETWSEMPVRVDFPEITLRPRMLPKRILGIAIDPEYPNEIYAAMEVGGLLRSRDFGRAWEQVLPDSSDSYDALDLHSVTVRAPREIHISHRLGIQHSTDGGETWHTPAMDARVASPLYCRMVRVAPDEPQTMYLASGGPFDDAASVMKWGELLRSRDGGRSWQPLALTGRSTSTIFTVAVDPRSHLRVFCGNYGGQVFHSQDGGETWHESSLPGGATQIYAMAIG
jgi:photosystem II stability/assembly factor-like uncharacterized protein